MTHPSNDDLTALAVQAALMAIREGDNRRLKVTLTFNAKREFSGVMIDTVTLGYSDHPKPKPS